jgi:hypothetical protein
MYNQGIRDTAVVCTDLFNIIDIKLLILMDFTIYKIAKSDNKNAVMDTLHKLARKVSDILNLQPF